MHARVPEQSALDDWTLVGACVIKHKVQVQLSENRSLHRLQEVAELRAAMAPVHFCDDRTGLDVERREEIGGAVADVVVLVVHQWKPA